jgi:D-3-phosphoglycerate dehydrogenase / 2-oxoglutarate reductase
VTVKVLVCDKIADEGVKILEDKGYEVTQAWRVPKLGLCNFVEDYDVLIVRSATKVNAELFARAKKLKVVGRAGEGLDNIDLKKAEELRIAVVNTPQVAAVSVAELTLGHLLAMSRDIVEGTVSLREGKWIKPDLMGIELRGKTLGIIGCGNIGKEVERLANCLGMQVLDVDICVNEKFVSMEEMLPRADFVTIHVPLTPHTWHMISSKQFAIMKDGVMLVNCSRGGVVDEDALYDALVSGKVRSAALDVFEEEPPKSNRLLSLRNVIATPHVGAQTWEAQAKSSVLIADQVIAVLEKAHVG